MMYKSLAAKCSFLALACFVALGASCTADTDDSTNDGFATPNGKADAPFAEVTGDHAATLTEQLEAAGSSVGVSSITALDRVFLIAHSVFCLAKDFQNRCFVSSQDFEPAHSRAQVTGVAADQIWHAIKASGLHETLSNTSDGSNGFKVLRAGTVRCVSDATSGDTACTLDPEAWPGRLEDLKQLQDGDARTLVAILTGHGAADGVELIHSTTGAQFLQAYHVFCLGKNFQNQCFVSSQDIEPAFSRATIPDPDATIIWHLLKKAGFEIHISNLSDGTNGSAVLTAGTVRCRIDPDSFVEVCGFDADGIGNDDAVR